MALVTLVLLATFCWPVRADAIGVVETFCVDDNATGYATFQSHNQKVVWTRNGIFMTHLRSHNEAFTAQQWRLSRSVDGGRTFATIHEETNATNPPAIEADEDANLYLVRPDFVDGNAYLYRFLAARDYRDPIVSVIPNGSAGKYCMVYDGPRKRLCYFGHNNTFHIIGLDGVVQSSYTITRDGTNACIQYPLLTLDPDGTLYAAWTTQAHGRYLYWDIHCMASADGGLSWRKLDGTALELPVVADDTGPTDRLTLDDEFEAHTWLSSVLARDGKLHFAYEAQLTPPREHYMRYDLATGLRDLHVQPRFAGETLELMGLDGFFASRAGVPGAPLYCVMASDGKVACLVSRDNGATWQDHAVSASAFEGLYSIGGCREVTPDGYIIGSFTESTGQPAPRVHFLRIQAR